MSPSYPGRIIVRSQQLRLDSTTHRDWFRVLAEPECPGPASMHAAASGSVHSFMRLQGIHSYVGNPVSKLPSVGPCSLNSPDGEF